LPTVVIIALAGGANPSQRLDQTDRCVRHHGWRPSDSRRTSTAAAAGLQCSTWRRPAWRRWSASPRATCRADWRSSLP